MAHLSDSAAMFSPSVARIAASAAKDWKYVDNWLQTKFRGRSPPTFERNPETLQALLALASRSDAADEERQLVARAEVAALREIQAAEAAAKSREDTSSPVNLGSGILDSLEYSLGSDGRTSLDALASLSVELDIAHPTPEALGDALIELQAQVFDLQEMYARVHVLRQHVQGEARQADDLLHDLEGRKYAPAVDLGRQNLDLQRKIKTMSSRLPEMEGRHASMETSVSGGACHPSIEDVARQESGHLNLLARKMHLDAHVAQFAGLPDDPGAARRQLETLRCELRSLSRKRDVVFEGLVERATPRK